MSPPLSQYTAKLFKPFGLIIPGMIATHKLKAIELLTCWRQRRGDKHRVCRNGVQGQGSAYNHLHTFRRNYLYCGPCNSVIWIVITNGNNRHNNKATTKITLTLQMPVMSSQESAWPLQLHGKHTLCSLKKNPLVHTCSVKRKTKVYLTV